MAVPVARTLHAALHALIRYQPRTRALEVCALHGPYNLSQPFTA